MNNTKNPHMMKQFIFVYGTLQEGCSNFRFLQDAVQIGRAKTEERYIMRAEVSDSGSVGIPFVGKSQAISTIHGEVYEVSPEQLLDVDRLEGCCIDEQSRSWYHRELIDVRLNNGSCIQAWLYFNEGSGETIIDDGFWGTSLNPMVGEKVWYFAYGSNQDVQRLLTRKVPFDQRFVGVLPEFQRVFNKRSYNQPVAYANIAATDASHSGLRGILYRTTKSGLSALDRFEGAPNHYRRETMSIQLEHSGQWVDAVVYVAQEAHLVAGYPVKAEYRQCVAAGMDLLGHPDSWTDTVWPEVVVD